MAFDRLAEELKPVGLVTYFLPCFALVLTLKKLFVAQYAAEFYGVSASVIGALVVGKTVVLLDHTESGTVSTVPMLRGWVRFTRPWSTRLSRLSSSSPRNSSTRGVRVGRLGSR